MNATSRKKSSAACVAVAARVAVLVAASMALGVGGGGCATSGTSGGSPAGSEDRADDKDKAVIQALAKKVKGQIVWSSSRLGNHDLFVMNTDGTGVKPITSGEAVDWFPRYSPDGSKILFTRSKKGWVYERDANTEGKWDIYTVTPEGKDETKIIDNASWGGWLSSDEIIYARGMRIYRRKLAGGDETLLVDSTQVPALDGALVQQPEMSKDGRFIAITLSGSKRETGIWNVTAKTWTRTGDGCQINWAPAGNEIYWVHPTGNGGSRVLHMAVDNGRPAKDADAEPDSLVLIDIPGRRSHEYFPELSADGKFLVWAATQRGHDHDIADYEIYLWEVGAPPEAAARLTFHSGNDRWPDIFIPGAVAATPAPSAGETVPRGQAAGTTPPAEGSATKSAAPDAPASDADESPAKSKHGKKKKRKQGI